MSTRSGTTVAGVAFHTCTSLRMGRPFFTYFVNGKRVAKAEYLIRLAEAQAQALRAKAEG